MTSLMQYLTPMLTVAAMFMLFGMLRPGEDCGGHCRSCSGDGASCGTHQPSSHV